VLRACALRKSTNAWSAAGIWRRLGYGAWLSLSTIPKLLILGDPGAIITGRTRDFCRTWRNQREVWVRGRHFLQEDSPDQIGVALAEFVASLSVRV
jgi:haloalkane dehalogenase